MRRSNDNELARARNAVDREMKWAGGGSVGRMKIKAALSFRRRQPPSNNRYTYNHQRLPPLKRVRKLSRVMVP